jgi:hypothetical protein
MAPFAEFESVLFADFAWANTSVLCAIASDIWSMAVVLTFAIVSQAWW